jgi:tRNA(Ile)-lysidine synthase
MAFWDLGFGIWDLTALHQHVRRTIRRYDLLPSGSRVLVGLSGGSDSVALTRLLIDLSEHGEFTVAGVGHLNHGLRTTAARDEVFCREFAERLGLPIAVETAAVRDYAVTESLSVEDAGRRLRYGFLERAAVEMSASRIAVGHTQDDQAETFLLKLMRGAGLTGLGGIYPRRGAIVRPLLDVTRDELRVYLRSRAETWVEDETNLDLDNPRNRIRHRVLPELDLAAAGSTRAAISRAAALIREDGQWLDALSDERFHNLARRTHTGLEFDARSLAEAPPPVLRRVLLQAMREAGGAREIGLEHVEAVTALLSGGQGGVDVPGARVELRDGKLVLLSRGVV